MKIASPADFAAPVAIGPSALAGTGLLPARFAAASEIVLSIALAHAPERDARVAEGHPRLRNDQGMKHGRTLHSPTLGET
jgi:hypothetical protein